MKGTVQRILYVALCAFTFSVYADGSSVSEEEIRELAEKYLDHPVVVTQGCPCPADCSPDGSSKPFQLPDAFSVPPQPQHDQPQPEQPHLNAPQQPQTLLQAKDITCDYKKPRCSDDKCGGYTVNFEDISVIELIQFISKISGRNYIFDSADLQFKITIVSEDATSVIDLSAALLQVLKMHGLSVVEQGNNVLIYKNENMSKVSTVITDENINKACESAVITRVFRLCNVDPEKTASIIKPLVSKDAIVEVSEETRHLIVSDITANVNKIADLLQAIDTPSSAFDVAEYRVRSAYPSALVAYAKEILIPLAGDNPLELIAQPSSHKIFIVSTPYMIQKSMQVLKSLDTADITDVADLPPNALANNKFEMYKLRYQNGREIATAMREIGVNLQYAGVANLEFVNTIYSIQWIEANNSIIVTGSEDSIKKVLDLLEELDTPPKQVYIEVLIIDTTLTNSLDFGVQWIALGDEQDKLAYASGLLSNSPPAPNLQGSTSTSPGARFVAANPAANPPSIPNPGRDVALPTPAELNGIVPSNFTSSFGLGIIGNILRHNGQSFLTLGALVTALDEESDTAIVLNPRVMVEDTQPASFFVGQNIPYQTTSTVIQQTGSVTQNIQYEDIGVQLRVTPTISPNNVVTLQIDQTIAELAAGVGVGNLTPTTDKTLSTTRVHVPDGTFLVMSGSVRDRTDYIRSGIPCLGTLPLIGPTFSRSIEQRQKRNLIFFVRPKVITNIQEGIELTNQEGYDYNFESHPCSIIECGTEKAPENETYPPPLCPDH